MDLKLFDKRVVMRNIAKGVVSKEEYRKYLKTLGDLSDECEEIEVLMFDEDKEEEASEEADSEPGEEVE